jgi:GDPmannose 4,6-dehydratase
MKRAIITGITGQDGSYLTELLLEKGYEVHGIIRRSSSFNTGRIDHLYRDPHLADVRLFLHYGDLLDGSSLRSIIAKIEPDEIYNLGAQSHVKVSFEVPEFTTETVYVGALRLFEAVRDVNEEIKIYQAGSSEMFGSTPPPQDEFSTFKPQSPYGIAKVAAHHLALNYRDAYGMFISNGILFNHESPRRGETFVTRKVCKAAAMIAQGKQKRLYIGNLDAKRDWGFAGDYVEAMWHMLQLYHPNDFVIATGEMHTVRELCELAFSSLQLDWKEHVYVDEKYLRPTEVDALCGNATKAKMVMGWTPKTKFKQLINMMVLAELAEITK